ncbi:MAG: hypothetical protein NVSMB45_09530 [Ginsengibacter sp.]
MKKNLIIIAGLPVAFFLTIIFATSCNKKLEKAIPINFPQDALTIGDYITNDTTFSLYKAMVVKVGSYASLTDQTQVFTVFAPNNNAMRNFAIPLTANFIANASPGQVAGILAPLVRYSIIPGEILSKDAIPESFPNLQLPTLLAPQTIPGTILPFALTAFPSRRGSNYWYNATPALGQVATFKNGVVHSLSKVVVPPSAKLADLFYNDANFTIFKAAIARGDVGQPAAATIDGALNNPGANLTLFLPTNDAMKQLIFGLSGGAVPIDAPDAVFIGFINAFVSPTTARGLVVYHIIGARTFSVNMPNMPTFIPTLLNLGIPNHPGVKLQSFFNAGGTVDSIKVYGVGNGGVAATSKPPTTFDKLAVNGVLHVIDAALLPQ